MKAVAVFPKSRTIRVIDDHPEPRLESPTQVRLRMLEVGVCGTDKEIARFDYGTPPLGSEYLVLGHESLGEVIETGDAVGSLHPGDLAVMTVRRPCGHASCPACRHGRQDFCFTGDFRERGIKEAHGFMTTHVVEEEHYLHRVPAELREVAVLTEPLTIAEKALTEFWQIQTRLPWLRRAPVEHRKYLHEALVLGAGPVGLLGAMVLLEQGFKTWVYSRDPADSAKAKLVKSLGGLYVSAATESLKPLGAQMENLDVIYEATGASQLAFDATELLGANGVFIFTGVPGRKAPAPTDTAAIMRRLVLQNQVLLGSVNAGPPAFDAAIKALGRFAARWPGAMRSLITGRFPMEAHDELLRGDPGGIKNVISIAE